MTRLLLFVALAAAPGEAPPTEPARRTVLSIPHERYTLPNGLEVVLHQDQRLPLVAVNLWYHVGAYHEVPA
jgi:predicted Zn-dependent peptidase